MFQWQKPVELSNYKCNPYRQKPLELGKFKFKASLQEACRTE